MSRRSGRGHINKDSALQKLGAGRDGAIQVLREAKIGSPEYKFAGHVADAVDDLAEKLTGNRNHFHTQPGKTAPRKP